MGRDEPERLVRLLALVPAGRATVTIGGRPLLSVDSDEKTLEVDADGAREVGLSLSHLMRLEGPLGALGESGRVSGALSRAGWKLTLYADGSRVLSMGSGVSRLTGHVSVNPLRLKKLLGALK